MPANGVPPIYNDATFVIITLALVDEIVEDPPNDLITALATVV